MNRLSILWFLILGGLIVLVLINCSRGSDSPLSPESDEPDRSPVGGTISLGEPVINGDEISIPIEFSDADDIYAMSFRVGFDPDELIPLGVDWSDVVGEEDSTFQLLDRQDFIPLAFARFSPTSGLDGNGSLCTMRFRFLGAGARPWIITDPAYLVARDSINRSLILDIRGVGQ